jgi:putative DNA primase/helicase
VTQTITEYPGPSKAPSAEAIASALGSARQTGPVTWRCDCPACGYPTLEVFTKNDGSIGAVCWKCRNDGNSRAPTEQLKARGLIRSLSAKEAALARAATTAEALKVWAESVPVDGTEAASYLASRAIPPPYPERVRAESGGRPYYDGGPLVAWRLVCLVEHITQGILRVHAINLWDGGRRKAHGAKTYHRYGGVFDGGGVWLGTPGGELVVGEGLETTLSAMLILDRPWGVATLGGRGMKRLDLPEAAEQVCIAADNDDERNDFAGQRAAAEAKARWLEEGRSVRIATPNQPGADFNDVLVGRKRT